MDLEALLQMLQQGSVQLGLRLLYAIAILIVGMKLAKWLAGKISRSGIMGKIEPNLASFIQGTSLLALRAGVVFVAGYVLGVPGTAYVTLFGSIGVAIGLAMQGSLGNLAGGLMILLFHPFVVGDYISVGEYEGTVKQISAFYTAIATLDNRRILLPNGTLTNSVLVNNTAEQTRMLQIELSVGYDSDPERVRSTVLECVRNEPLALLEPEPVVPMTAHGNNALTFTLRVWVRRENLLRARWNLLESIKRAFDREGISIPYPQMDVHMKPAEED